MPTTASITWSGKKLEPYYRPQDASSQAVKLPASVTLARGTVMGEKTATPGTFGAYDAGNSDGTEVARGLLVFDVASDSSGKITMGDVSTGGELLEKLESTPVYMQGFFKTSELTGLTQAALDDMGGALVSGTIADGVIRIG